MTNRGDGQMVKPFEIRSWATSYRGPLAIASTKTSPYLVPELVTTIGDHRFEFDHIEKRWYLYGRTRDGIWLPLGAIVGSVRLVDCVPNHLGSTEPTPQMEVEPKFSRLIFASPRTANALMSTLRPGATRPDETRHHRPTPLR